MTTNVIKNKSANRLMLDSQTAKEKLQMDLVSLLIKRQQYQEALNQYKIILNVFPHKLPDIMTHLYRCVMQQFSKLGVRLIIIQLYLYTDQLDLAFDELEEAIEIDPKSSEAYAVLGKLVQKNYRKSDITTLFEDAISQDIFDSAILDLLPKIYMDENLLDKNIQLHQTLIKQFPDTITYYQSLAELYKKTRQYDLSAEILDQVASRSPQLVADCLTKCEELVKYQPKNAFIRETVVRNYLKACQPEKAVQHMREISRVHPERINDVVTWCKQALSAFPDSPDILLVLSESLASMCHYTESVQCLRTIYENAPQDQGDIISRLKSIIKKFPDQVAALFLLVDIHLGLQAYKDALGYLEALIKINPAELDAVESKIKQTLEESDAHGAYAQYLLAKVTWAQGKPNQAIELCDTIHAPDFGLKAKLLVSEIYQSLGLMNQSAAIFNQLADHRFDPDLHARLQTLHQAIIDGELAKTDQSHQLTEGFLKLRRGRVIDAVDCFQQIPSDNQALFQKAQVMIGRCFIELGRFDLAGSHLEKLLTKWTELDIKQINDIRYWISLAAFFSGHPAKCQESLHAIFETDIRFPGVGTWLKGFSEKKTIPF